MNSNFLVQQEQISFNNNLPISMNFENGLEPLKNFIKFRKLKNRFFIYSSFLLISTLIVLILKIDWTEKIIDFLNSKNFNLITKEMITSNHWLLYVFLSCAFLILGFTFLVNLINLHQLKIGIKTYKTNQNNKGIPFLAKQLYKKQLKKKYYVNWICLIIYWLILISTLSYTLYTFYLLKKPDIKSLIIHNKIVYIVSLSTFSLVILFQIWSLISIKYLKGNLESIYATEFFTPEEIVIIQQSANRIGKWIFIITVSITVVIISIFFIFFKVERRKLSDITKIFTVFKK